jgi:hypothetical protein
MGASVRTDRGALTIARPLRSRAGASCNLRQGGAEGASSYHRHCSLNVPRGTKSRPVLQSTFETQSSMCIISADRMPEKMVDKAWDVELA